MELQAVVALVVGVLVVLFVPALVWSAVISGLYQTVREKLRSGLSSATQKDAARAE